MRNIAQKLLFHKFTENDPILSLPSTIQTQYIHGYFASFDTTSVVEEQNYFDRDYLAEFATFYGVSAAGYKNVCRRLHFFSGPLITRNKLKSAIKGNLTSIRSLKENYLGFVVIRPIPSSPLGRTVVKWYEDQNPGVPRVTEPSRIYTAHLCGIELEVEGIAWQQQDAGVSACATIGLWSMFHSSAFDDNHSIPTTSAITRAANRSQSFGRRVFPAMGLTVEQVCEAIKTQYLSPIIIEGDIEIKCTYNVRCFSRVKFSSSCAAFLRSGYPVLLAGTVNGHGHAVVAIGFRSSSGEAVPSGEIAVQDASIKFIYLHDDNIGPNIRFEILNTNCSGPDHIVLKASAPSYVDKKDAEKLNSWPEFIPNRLIVAVNNDLRTSPRRLSRIGFENAEIINMALDTMSRSVNKTFPGLVISPRFLKLPDYLKSTLKKTLKENLGVFTRVILDLGEKVPPMSLHIGVVRIGFDDSTPLLDIIYDTTDSDKNHPVYASVCYQSGIYELVKIFKKIETNRFGVVINAS